VLADLAAALGEDRRAVACRELTKTYEEVRRTTLGDLAEWAANGLRGELTLVIAGAPATSAGEPSADELGSEVATMVATGLSRRDAVDAVAAKHGISRRQVYSVTNRV
jgi:16S rRNA (cytidine1402-2'-O)-methyltransferase